MKTKTLERNLHLIYSDRCENYMNDLRSARHLKAIIQNVPVERIFLTHASSFPVLCNYAKEKNIQVVQLENEPQEIYFEIAMNSYEESLNNVAFIARKSNFENVRKYFQEDELFDVIYNPIQ